MIETWLNNLSILIQSSVWLAPLIALLAGVLTSVTPCALSSVPLVIGYVGGTGGGDTKRAFRLSLTFAIGMAVTFTALGTVASLLGKLMGTSSTWWYLVLGVLMVLMALQTFEIYNFIPSTYLISKNTKKGYIGAFVAGVFGGLFGGGKKSDCCCNTQIVEETNEGGCGCGPGCDCGTEESAPFIEGAMSIKVLGPGCKSCVTLMENTKLAVKQLDIPVNLEKITDMSAIASYGIMSAPGLVINEKVVSYGKALKPNEIIKFIEQEK